MSIGKVEELERELAACRYALALARMVFADSAECLEIIRDGHRRDIAKLQKEERRLESEIQAARRLRAWEVVPGLGISQGPR